MFYVLVLSTVLLAWQGEAIPGSGTAIHAMSPSNKGNLVSCDFNQSMCDWSVFSFPTDNTYSWKLENQLPETKRRSYLTLITLNDFSSGSKFSTVASGTIDGRQASCLKFYYYYSNGLPGFIKIFVKTSDNSRQMVWSINNNNKTGIESAWNEANIDLRAYKKETFNIEILGGKLRYYRSMFAIKDVLVLSTDSSCKFSKSAPSLYVPKPINNTFNCDFTSPNETACIFRRSVSSIGWINALNTDFIPINYWPHNLVLTETLTLNILSKSCLSIVYDINKKGSQSKIAFAVSTKKPFDKQESRTTILKDNNMAIRGSRTAFIELKSQGEIVVQLEAYFTDDRQSIMSVKYIRLLPCSDFLTCNFDTDVCGWEDGPGDFKWKVGQGKTPSKETGPDTDHSGSGRYLYMEASEPRKQGHAARIESRATDLKHVSCVTFWYHMYGKSTGSLKLYIKRLDPTSAGYDYIWSADGINENRWMTKKVSLKNSKLNVGEKFKIGFEGVVGKSWDADIGLDDVVMNTAC